MHNNCINLDREAILSANIYFLHNSPLPFLTSYNTISIDSEDIQSSSSSSLPLQIMTAPKMLTPSTPKHKRKAGRKIFKETRHPVYRGVRRKKGGKWVCEVREPTNKSRIWLGTFPSPEAAAVAHDVAAMTLHCDNASLNFPDSAGGLPHAKSFSHQDIRRAASRAAKDFIPFSRFSQESQEQNTSTSSLTTSDESKDSGTRNNVEFMCNLRDEERVSDSAIVVGFMDEEEMFNMPVLLDSMAEGMLLTPLALKKGFSWSQYEVDDGVELNLWENLSTEIESDAN